MTERRPIRFLDYVNALHPPPTPEQQEDARLAYEAVKRELGKLPVKPKAIYAKEYKGPRD